MPIVGDCRETIADLVVAVQEVYAAGTRADLTGWWKQLDGWRETYPLGYDEPTDGSLAPQHVIARIGQIAGPEAIYASGVGQHQMWASQFISYENPYTWLNSGGAGTMGYSVPAAMGAKVGRPDATVWAIDGDGCFQMTNQELVTCAIEGIPIKVAVINNGNLGMVRQWQTLFYDGRYSNTNLQSKRIPDFVKLADAMGCVGLRCDDKADVDATIEKAMAVDDAPVVIDFVVGAGRDGLADGAGRHEQRRDPGRPRHPPRLGTRTTSDDVDDPDGHTATRCPSSSRTSPASSPASPRCSAGAASTSSRSPSARPSTPPSAA